MFALNFQWPQNEELLIGRKKDCTVRLGDIREIYPENSVVWVTVGPKYGAKRKLYPAMIDTIYTKEFHALTLNDLGIRVRISRRSKICGNIFRANIKSTFCRMTL